MQKGMQGWEQQTLLAILVLQVVVLTMWLVQLLLLFPKAEQPALSAASHTLGLGR
jgi:hypothetical protein